MAEWNVRGTDDEYGITGKKSDIFWKNNLDLSGIYKTYVRGSGTFDWNGVWDLRWDLLDGTESCAKESVGILIKDG